MVRLNSRNIFLVTKQDFTISRVMFMHQWSSRSFSTIFMRLRNLQEAYVNKRETKNSAFNAVTLSNA